MGGDGSGDGAFGEFVIKFLNQSSRNPVFVPIPVPINMAVSHTATIVLYEIDYYYYLPLFLFHFFFFLPPGSLPSCFARNLLSFSRDRGHRWHRTINDTKRPTIVFNILRNILE